jgi:hypothetical protein
LPPWTGPLSRLFDDSFDRLALELGKPTPPHEDPLFRQRAQQADTVVRVRVVRVAHETAGARRALRVSLLVVGDPIVGPRVPEPAIDLEIARESPAFAGVQVLDARLVGRSFVALLKRFAGQGEARLHLYLTAESPEVVKGVQDAQVLAELAR